jgi:hypothetical protein
MATFLAVENSGPIYRGDNMDLIGGLGASVRKRFHATRHAFSKQAFHGALESKEVVRAFRAVLPENVFKKGSEGSSDGNGRLSS